jgi:hypothetical protein
MFDRSRTRFHEKNSKKAAQDFHRAVSKIFDRVKSVALVNIHFQLIIITNVSILTNPAYFVPPSCHCGILALRSRDFCDY